MSVVGNILEQEDELKGLSNDRLLQEIQVPSGLFAPFLPPSEMQRRNEMRERYEASQEQPSNTIVEQIVAEGMGGIAPIGQEGYPPASPMDMLSQPMGSPIPTDLTSQVPVVAAAGAFPDGAMAIEDSGLGGMGGFTEPPMEPQMEQFPQMVSGGGVVGMQAGRQVPDQASSQRALVKGKHLVSQRGENWQDYTLSELVEIGRTDAAQEGWDWKSNLFGANHPLWDIVDVPVSEPEVEQETPYWQEEDYVPPLDILDVYSGESYGGTGAISPEIASAQIQEQSISGRRQSDIDEMRNDPERFPAHAARDRSEGVIDDWDALSGPYRTTQLAKEKALFGTLYTGRTAEAAGEGIREIGQGLVGPYTDDPATQREGFVQKYITDPAADIGGTLKAGWEDLTDGEMMMSVPLSDTQGQAEIQALLGLGKDAFQTSVDAVRDFELSDIERAGQSVMDYFDSGYESPVAGGQQGVLEGVGRGVLDVTKEGLGRLADWWKEGYGRDIGSDQGSLSDTFGEVVMALQHPDAAPESVREAELQTEPDEVDGEGLVGGSITTPPASVPGGLDIPRYDLDGGGGYMNALVEDHRKRSDEADELAVRAKEDEATAMTEIESLISKTQDDARKDAFDAWMMNVGAGVASGDMAGGLQRGAEALGVIKKEARDTVRSLDATRLSRYFEGSKAEMDRLVARASMDASFASALVNIIVEQGRAGRADKILIGSVFDAMGEDVMGAYDEMSTADRLRAAQQAVTGMDSDVATFNRIEGALE